VSDETRPTPSLDELGGLVATTCWTMLCAECGTDWADDAQTRSHFDTDEQAEMFLFADGGFTTRDDGRVLCPGCSARADCAEDGHQYLPWRPAPDHIEIEWRCCGHCGGGFEDRLTALGGGDQR
jgi:hypothetical protein